MTTIDTAQATPASGRTMPRRSVFIDADVLTAEGPAPDRRHGARRIVAPGASEAIELLTEGHDVVVDGLILPAAGPGLRRTCNLPPWWRPGSCNP